MPRFIEFLIEQRSFEKRLLNERVNKSDIIDLFIIMSMPKIATKAGKFIQQEIVQRARANILAELESIVVEELEHFCGYGEVSERSVLKHAHKLGKIFLDDNIEVPKRNKREWLIGFREKICERMISILKRAIPHKFTIDEINDMTGANLSLSNIAYLYKNLRWPKHYGGKPWADFTTAVGSLKNTQGTEEFIRAFERIIDLVHNTGSILDKFHGYQEGWMPFILDLKQHTHNVRDLFPYASKDLRTLLSGTDWRGQTTYHTGIDPVIIHNGLQAEDPSTYFENLVRHYGTDKILELASELFADSTKKQLSQYRNRLLTIIDEYNMDSPIFHQLFMLINSR